MPCNANATCSQCRSTHTHCNIRKSQEPGHWPRDCFRSRNWAKQERDDGDGEQSRRDRQPNQQWRRIILILTLEQQTGSPRGGRMVRGSDPIRWMNVVWFERHRLSGEGSLALSSGLA